MRAVKFRVPVFNAVNAVVIRVFGRATDEKAITDFFLVFVAGPTVAIFAQWNLVPLAAFVEPAHSGQFWPMPNRSNTFFEDVAHACSIEAVQTTDRDVAVRVDCHGCVECATWDSIAFGLEPGKAATRVDLANADGVHARGPEIDKCVPAFPRV